jgi:hypothetical protein
VARRARPSAGLQHRGGVRTALNRNGHLRCQASARRAACGSIARRDEVGRSQSAAGLLQPGLRDPSSFTRPKPIGVAARRALLGGSGSSTRRPMVARRQAAI